MTIFFICISYIICYNKFKIIIKGGIFMQNSSPHRSSIGQLNANSVAALCYGITLILFFIRGFQFCAWLLPLAVYILEKESAFVKFHAFFVKLSKNVIIYRILYLFSASLPKLYRQPLLIFPFSPDSGCGNHIFHPCRQAGFPFRA